MIYNSKAFATALGKLRVQRGLTQDNASALAGISRSHWAALESAKKTPRLDTLWSIAQALGVAPEELVAMVEHEMAKRTQ